MSCREGGDSFYFIVLLWLRITAATSIATRLWSRKCEVHIRGCDPSKIPLTRGLAVDLGDGSGNDEKWKRKRNGGLTEAERSI